MVVVGAGLSGLACARELASGGRAVVVLDRARGVGGRCATRRVEGQAVDFGLAFLHGRDPEFLAALEQVPAERLDGWPFAIAGAGSPCQPHAFSPGERRLAFAGGISAFPKHLAAGLEVRLRTAVTAIAPAGGALRLAVQDGPAIEAEEVVLALAAEQAHELLGTVPGAPREIQGARGLLAQARSHPCLALIAAYAPSTPPPPWDALYPTGSGVLQLVSHDSSKRPRAGLRVLVYQAHARWSRLHLEDADWPVELLREATRLLGPWAARPVATDAHRWRWARNDRSAELAGPLLLTLEGGPRLGVCGDRFAPGAGAEAAWRSGRALARRMLDGGGR